MSSPSGPLLTGLYVPGDRPDRFDKAVTSGAHLVILDLEDAVAPGKKELARSAVADWLTARADVTGGPVIQVRISAGEPLDLSLLAGIDGAFEVRVPKVETPSDVDTVASVVPGHAITALIETARGVENAVAIAAHPAVTRLGLGEADLASDLGTAAAPAMDYARVRLLFAARAAGLPAPMLSVFPDIRNLDALRDDTERGRALGWVGRTAIHPSQLPVIADVFQPSAEERAWANEVLAAASGGGVSTLASGEMVDAAMTGRARAILGLAGIRDSADAGASEPDAGIQFPANAGAAEPSTGEPGRP